MVNPKSIVVLAVAMCAVACGGSDVEPITGDVVVTMTVKSLPSQVAINQTATPDGRVEYMWETVFDINNSGAIDDGDLALTLLQYKRTGALEEMVAVDELDAGMWSVGVNGGISFRSVIPVQVVGNTIRLVVDRATFMTLGDITSATGVNFWAMYYDDATDSQYYDVVPTAGAFLDLSASGVATDPTDDVEDFNGNVSALFPWVDLTEVTVSVL